MLGVRVPETLEDPERLCPGQRHGQGRALR